MHYDYITENVCSQMISLNKGKVSNIHFTGGCNGNLKAIAKLVDGWDADDISAKLSGNTCGMRPTSCGDQLAKAVMAAKAAELGNA